jgi:rhodanese-related sulfurtransferase
MSHRIHRVVLVMIFAGLLALAPVLAQTAPEPEKVTAEQAFDAVVKQVDPFTGDEVNVVFVDARTRAEWFWVGTAAKVTRIELNNGQEIVPELGKVTLDYEGRLLEFEAEVEGRGRRYRAKLPVRHVADLDVEPLAYWVPFKTWDSNTGEFAENPDFTADVESLAVPGERNVVIYFCRSGGRTNTCGVELSSDLFETQYEIDQPDGKSGRGGMEGSTYGNVFNGYRGFPGRWTFSQEHPSVSWKDTGLPIVIGASPKLPPGK